MTNQKKGSLGADLTLDRGGRRAGRERTSLGGCGTHIRVGRCDGEVIGRVLRQPSQAQRRGHRAGGTCGQGAVGRATATGIDQDR